VLRIRNGSDFGSGSGLKLVSDSDPDTNPGFGSRSETGQNFFFFVLKFLPSLIFKHKKAALPQLRDLATNKVRNKFAGFGSGSISKRHGSADPDPYQKVTYPQLRTTTCKSFLLYCDCEICTYIHMNYLISA
jgi:hypothetical protein